jgi:hypothetical protein
MKKLIAAVVSSAVVLVGLAIGASPAAAAGSWDYSNAKFTINDGQGGIGTVTAIRLRSDGSSATGYVMLQSDRYTCYSSDFSGMTARFWPGLFAPCTGSLTFSVSSTGALELSGASALVSSRLFGAPSSDTAQGRPYPPVITCSVVADGSTAAKVTFDDPGSPATSYAASSVPALPSSATQVTAGNVITVNGLAPGATYAFTVTGAGSTAGPGGCTGSVTTPALPNPPTGTVTYGKITGTTSAASVEYALTMSAAPAGWAASWVLADGMTAAPPNGVLACGTPVSWIPRLVQGSVTIDGTAVAGKAICTVPTPTFVSGAISGDSVTVNYAFAGPVSPGVTVRAMVVRSGGPRTDISLGSPPAGGSAGTSTFSLPGLIAPRSAYVQLYAVNGPLDGPKDPQQRIPGDLPTFRYDTAATGAQGSTAVRPALPTLINSDAAAIADWRFELDSGRGLPIGLSLDRKTGALDSDGRPLAGASGSVWVVLVEQAGSQRRTPPVEARYDVIPNLTSPTQFAYPDLTAVIGSPVAIKPVVGSSVKGFFYAPGLCARYPGITIDSATGLISGSVSALAATSTVTVTVARGNAPGNSGCGQPQGGVVATTTFKMSTVAAPGQFLYTQAAVTALVGSPISDAPQSVPFTGSGITYAVTGGTLPAGLTLDAASGVISGTVSSLPTSPVSTVTVGVSQGASSASTKLTFTILPMPSAAVAAIAYPNVSAQATVPMSVLPSGTITGQTFALDQASLAAGMTIDPATGMVTWTPKPAQRGIATVTVSLSANGVSSGLAPFTITVGAAPATSQVAPGPGSTSAAGGSTGGAGGSSGSGGSGLGDSPCLAPDGTLYSDIRGSAGSTLTMAPNTYGRPLPDSFTVTGGALPRGVWLDGTYGVISGTPERSNGGRGPVEITASWADGTVRVSDFMIAIDDPHHAVNYPNRIIGSIGESTTVSPLPINAVGAKRFDLVCGTLPAGMTLDARTGVISGTPTTLDERPVPLRVRMTDSYGWVDSSFGFVVDTGVTPWLRYPELAEIGQGRRVTIVPTRSGLPTTDTYRIVGKLPPGLSLNRRTGTISGVPKVRDGLVYEPTITAFGKDGKPQASTVPSLVVVKPAVPMRVTARSTVRPLRASAAVVVAKVRHPRFSTLSAKVICSACRYTFNKSTGRLVVKAGKKTRKIVVVILASPRGAAATTAYAGHEWQRAWRVVR